MSRTESLTRDEIQDLDREELEDLVVRQSEEIGDLWDAVDGLRQTIESNHDPRIEAFGRQVELIKIAIAGSADEFSTWDVEKMEPLMEQVQNVAETLAEREEETELFMREDGAKLTPDDRAVQLRQYLLNQTEGSQDDTDGISRSGAAMVLKGGLHKGTVLDAMRRAADGHEADIDGSSKLEPVDAITFERGGTVGSGGEAQQSVLMIDRSHLTAVEARQILTTGDGGEGG